MNNTEKLIDKIVSGYEESSFMTKLDSDRVLNKSLIIEIVETLREILFPGFFSPNKISGEYVKYVIGEKIEFVEYNLKKQIAGVIGCGENCINCEKSVLLEKAEKITREFLEKIPKIREYLATDVEAALSGDPAATSFDEIILSYPGLFAVTVYRIAHELYLLNVPMIPRIMTEYAHGLTGIDIHPGASIGKYFFIDHGTGIVIGETTTIGDNVKIYQGVTLGALSTRKGQALRGVKRHPTLKDGVTVYSGTTILGGDTVIGEGATIGGNAFIVSSIEAKAKVVAKNPELEIIK